MFNFFWVLGIVPGTNFQLTFNEIMLGIFALLAAYYIYHHQQESKEQVIKIVQYSELHGFSFPVTGALEGPIGRKAAAPLANIFAPRLNQVVRLVRRAV